MRPFFGSPAHRGTDRQRGATLLFSVAILALLALFSVVFARLMSLERKASAYYSDRVRAKLASRAGLERAIVELQSIATRRHYSDPWADKWGYRLVRPANLGDRPLDLQTTREPSFFKNHDDATLQRLGNVVSYSGDLGIPYEDAILVFRLKILDGASQLNLNNPDGRAARRMLKNLLRALFDGQDGKRLISENDATTIANEVILEASEQHNRFQSKPQLGAALLAANNGWMTEDEWLQVVRDHVTVFSWVDHTVVRPWALNSESGTGPGEDAEAPRRRLGQLPRAPINVNTASEEVLTALFAELGASTRYGRFSVGFESAQRVAQQIVAYRGGPPREGNSILSSSFPAFRPFRSWPEFETFIDDMPGDVVFGSDSVTRAALPQPSGIDWAPSGGFFDQLITQHQVGYRDLIKAMCNPNTICNKFGSMPNHGGFRGAAPRLVDKTDITHMTTEASFDSMGVYEITSMGLILLRDEKNADVGYEILAAHTDQQVVSIYEPLRLTTQQDFEQYRAFMIGGNFIDSPESQGKDFDATPGFTASVNKATYFDGTDYSGTTDSMPVSGWPGVVSWPIYSLDREKNARAAPKTNYPMADWDGYLTLSNMITVRTGDSDFVAGFARGRLEAFKTRAWWEPIDRDPETGTFKSVDEPPSRPFDAAVALEVEPALRAGLVGGEDNTEIGRLATPMTGPIPARADAGTSLTPRVFGALSGTEAGLLSETAGEDDTGTDIADAQGMFVEGSALMNTGVLISPDRTTDGGDPQFLAFDGDNIDLVRGTTIRFWVQPLRDPYAQDEEVLFSFMGSNGSRRNPTTGNLTNVRGDDRQVGFRVYKEVEGSNINITLEPLGDEDPSDPSIDYNWGSDNSLDRVRVNVTPFTTTPEFTRAPLPPAGGRYQVDPRAPEWIPGSWHWIVINIGPTEFDGEGRRATATLQVDKYISPPLSFKGDQWAVTDAPEYGELLGHLEGSGVPSEVAPLSIATMSNPNVKGWIVPRLLGDYYHCQATDPPSRAAAGQTSLDGTTDPHGPGVYVVRKEQEFGGPGAPVMAFGNGPAWIHYRWAAAGQSTSSFGWYFATDEWPESPFPYLSYNHRMTIRCYIPGSDNYVGASADVNVRRNGDGTWQPEFPQGKSNNPSIPDCFGPDAAVPSAPSNPPGPSSGGYPGDQEWEMRLLVQWEEAHYMAGSEFGNDVPESGDPVFVASGVPTVLPPDPSTLYSVEDPVYTALDDPTNLPPELSDYQILGETLPYSVHNSGPTVKGGMGVNYTHPNTSKRSYVRTKVPLPRVTGVSQFPDDGPGPPIPLIYIDDDCHGCEDCDVDGPVFIGGEPAGDQNYQGGDPTQLATVDETSMACAVFDNIVFLNGDPERRTELRPDADEERPELYADGAINLRAPKRYEDRFFESDLGAYLDSEGAPESTGSVYHRGILELGSSRRRLASATWTVYPTSTAPSQSGTADPLNFEVGFWRINNTFDPGAGIRVFDYSNRQVGDTPPPAGPVIATPDQNPQGSNLNQPDFGNGDNGFQADPNLGIRFSTDTGITTSSAFLDGLGDEENASDPRPPQLLIMGIRLQAPEGEGQIPLMYVETPIFEDLTINLITERPQILYAQEGAVE